MAGGLARPAWNGMAKAVSIGCAEPGTSAAQDVAFQWSFVMLDQVTTKADSAAVADGCG